MNTPIKLLIVEDSIDDALLVLHELELSGFEPTWCRVQTEAEFRVQLEKNPDIILSDYSMPQFSGLSAAKILQATGLNIPFILISGTVGEEIAVEAMKHGASDYLLKDRIGRLGSAVQRALDVKRLSDERIKNEERFHHLEKIQANILNALPAHVALIDTTGIIITVNDSWRRFAVANSLQSPDFAIGQNYLEVCHRAHGIYSEEARAAADGILRVLHGEINEFGIEYPCHSAKEQRWFRLIATPLREGHEVGAVIMHVNITELKNAGDEIGKQLHELQRWHEATLGRENRILELKREVNELLAAQQKPIRYPTEMS